jgi:hypothetical protein
MSFLVFEYTILHTIKVEYLEYVSFKNTSCFHLTQRKRKESRYRFKQYCVFVFLEKKKKKTLMGNCPDWIMKLSFKYMLHGGQCDFNFFFFFYCLIEC